MTEKAEETLARFVVEQVTGVRVCRYDDRGGTSRPDGIIHRTGGVPLEVVSDPSPHDMQLSNAVRKRDHEVFVEGLEKAYLVCLTGSAPVNNLDWLVHVLQIREPDHPLHHFYVPVSERYLFIEELDSPPAGTIVFTTGFAGSGPRPRPGDLTDAVLDILDRNRDVARKLAAYGGPERHALVMGDESQTPVFRYMRGLEARELEAEPAPVLPPEITHLWVVPRYIPGTVASWSRADGWQATDWQWGDPGDALRAWSDPDPCSEPHVPVCDR